MLRCSVCDYTQEEGSEYGDIAPSRAHVKFSPIHDEYFCDHCLSAIEDCLDSYPEIDEDDLDALD